LWIDATGPFNAELLRKIGEMAGPLLLPLAQSKKPWIEIATFHKSALFTTEALVESRIYLRSADEAGLCPTARAIVTPTEVEGGLIMADMLGGILRELSGSWRSFTDQGLAEAWARGFLLPEDQ
jgi:hypothetical protein